MRETLRTVKVLLFAGNGIRISKHFVNWAIDITSGLSDEQMERMLGNEHGGMNEVLADA